VSLDENKAIVRRFVDEIFVQGRPETIDALLADDFEVLGAVVALARALGLEVVAEGVETPAQLALLERAGCRRAQGFLLGEPEPAGVALHAA